MSNFHAAFDAELSLCRDSDSRRLRRQLSKLPPDIAKDDQRLVEIQKRLEKAKARFSQIIDSKPRLEFPQQLPICEQIELIEKTIKENQVTILAGETGSGKTTQLPKVCLRAGLGTKGMIAHTQPRRLAARSVATRIADELDSELGQLVGLQVRFHEQLSPESRIKVMTDGVLLNEIRQDPQLWRYDCIIIDEAHERSLNIDFLLGYIKNLLPKRPNLKVVITSATIDLERFSQFFDRAPIIKVEGRSYPVDILYQDALEDSLEDSVVSAIETCIAEEQARRWDRGDVLVFLPGEREIRSTAKAIKDAQFKLTEVLPLYARLSAQDQQRIFKSHSGRRIVLSTNVAETSLTVPGIRYVIDTGLARISRYSVRSKIQRLPIEPISQASANQRAGRCGRIAPGVCVRLYTEQDFLSRPSFTDPEIKRTNLASVILQLIDLKLGDIDRFPFIEKPERKQISDGFKLLFELEALDQHRRLSRVGKSMSRLSADPVLARILIESNNKGCLEPVSIIVSALSTQDPREMPQSKQEAARQSHAQFEDKSSDFAGLVNLWNFLEEARQDSSNAEFRRLCKKHYVSWIRYQEWRDVHRQLIVETKGLKLPQQDKTDSYEAVHQALLSGFKTQIALIDEGKSYKASRNKVVKMFPGSSLYKKPPKWIMSAEIVETSQIYARVNAKIEPEWVEKAAKHLVKHQYSEPHWNAKRGQVRAFEKLSLYGLPIVYRRCVNYANIDPDVCREIFIRSGLVEHEYRGNLDILKQNKKLITQIEAEEDKLRRRDIMVDDEVIFEHYNRVLPRHIVSARHFESWYKESGSSVLERLKLRIEQLKRQDSEPVDESLFPDTLENNGIYLPVSYRFEPGKQRDGATVKIPQSALRQINMLELEKLVPGLLKDKCYQLMKHLPRSIRRNLVPIPDTLDKIFPEIQASEKPLIEAITFAVKRHRAFDIPETAWNLVAIDPHLKFNVSVVDAKGKEIALTKNLEELGVLSENSTTSPVSNKIDETETIRSVQWDFGHLAESVLHREAGIELKRFPSLVDKQTHIENILYPSQLQAARSLRRACARLLQFQLKEVLASFDTGIDGYKEMGLYHAPVGQAKALYDDFQIYAISEHFLSDGLPRNQEQFLTLLRERRGDLFEHTQQITQDVLNTLKSYHTIRKSLKKTISLDLAMSMSDLKTQLAELIYPGFLSEARGEHIQHYPRYLEAAAVRLEKMPRTLADERRFVPQLTQWRESYQLKHKELERRGIFSAELEKFRWMLEEQRVSWFAQQLGTAYTTSSKRINQHWETIKLL